MKSISLLLLFTAGVVFAAGQARAQEGPLKEAAPAGITPEQIVQKFTAKEKEFKLARKRCTYRRSIKMQSMQGETADSDYQQVADIGMDENGSKILDIVLAPQASLSLSPEDAADLDSRLSFTLSTDELPQYKVTYKGQQQEDDLQCYVFDVEPKQIEKGRRYFQGRIWVDDRDFQIVRMNGKSVPDIYPKKKKLSPNLFPKFTTYRELMDGQYWYPTYSITDDLLHFPTGDVRIRGTVKATKFKCSGAAVEQSKAAGPAGKSGK